MTAPIRSRCRICGHRNTPAHHLEAAAAIVDEHYPQITRQLSRRVDQHLHAAEAV